MNSGVRILLSMLVPLAITSCVSAPPPPASPARRVAPPPVLALPAPAPLASDWRDWPQTPGEWRYGPGPNGTTAVFGDRPSIALSCNLTARRLELSPDGMSSGPVTIRTTSMTRMVPASSVTAEGVTTASLAANDPLLDAMAFSRGRFVVEQAGLPPLVLPAWAEVERVIEDCRN